MPDALTPTDDLDAASAMLPKSASCVPDEPELSLVLQLRTPGPRAQKGYFEEGKIMAKKSGKKLTKSKRIEKKQTLTVQKKTW